MSIFSKSLLLNKSIKEVYTQDQIIIEQAGPGTYYLDIEQDIGAYRLQLVGASGASAYITSWYAPSSSSDGRGQTASAGGGSGAIYDGVVCLKKGRYVITLGKGGEEISSRAPDKTTHTKNSPSGTSSSFSFGEEELINCGGGTGASVTAGYAANVASYTGGIGGKVTIGNLDELIPLQKLTGLNGKGSTKRNTSKTGSPKISTDYATGYCVRRNDLATFDSYGYVLGYIGCSSSSRFYEPAGHGYIKLQYCGLPQKVLNKYIFIMSTGNTIAPIFLDYSSLGNLTRFRNTCKFAEWSILKVVFKGYNKLSGYCFNGGMTMELGTLNSMTPHTASLTCWDSISISNRDVWKSIPGFSSTPDYNDINNYTKFEYEGNPDEENCFYVYAYGNKLESNSIQTAQYFAIDRYQ